MTKLRNLENKNEEECKNLMEPCIRIEEFSCEPNSAHHFDTTQAVNSQSRQTNSARTQTFTEMNCLANSDLLCAQISDLTRETTIMPRDVSELRNVRFETTQKHQRAVTKH